MTKSLLFHYCEELKENLRKCFQDEETFGFLKDNERWQSLIKPR